ncbi:murein biosynthesis integral membrane protein MurJ [Paenibacillus sp.]|uniref:murein biosynthesis integral membrane protein MurJ n=1 Tax=Paenibacillus sp. TaxID=58172 RepID=UPI002D761C3D|nr:murein biosynthesis integral membrane protein MurJ [Paenibacillus sp.]HZG84927.1 murein biosynthesis integral membrane protein MurJ [Paenibacillus sp.]
MNRYLKIGVILLFVTTVTRLLGFIRETIIAANFGASGVTDAFFIAVSIPNIIFTTISTTLGVIIVPTLTKISVRNPILFNQYSSFFFFLLLGIVFLISSIGIFLSPIIVNSLFNNLKYPELAIMLTALYFPCLIPMTLNHYFSSFLQVKKILIIPTLTQLLSNLVVVATAIYFSKTVGIKAVIVGTLIGLLLQTLILFGFSRNSDFKLSVKGKLGNIRDFLNEDIKKIAPILITTFVIQLNLLMDRFLGSFLTEGSISSLSYAFKINDFITGVIITAFGAILYPDFAELHQKNKIEDLKKLVFGSVRVIFLVTIPLVLGTIVYSEEIVRILFGYGNFDVDDITSTALCLLCYTLAIPFLILTSVLSRYYYAIEDIKTVLFNSLYYTVLNIVLSISLVNYLGARGIALAFSISSFVGAVMLLIKSHRRLALFNLPELAKFLIKVMSAAIIMVGLLYCFKTFVNINEIVEMGIGVFIGLGLYILFTLLLKVSDAQLLVKTLVNRGKKKQENVLEKMTS